MKKLALGISLALAGALSFAEPMTDALIAANLEKFLNGNGTFVKISEDVEWYYIPKTIIKSYRIHDGKLTFYAERESVSIGADEVVKANDVSIDANGNFVFKKK